MIKFAMAALLLLPCLSVYAEDSTPDVPQATPDKPKSRSLDDFIQDVMKNGSDRPIDSNTAGGVGLSGEIPSKAVRYKSSIAPDKRQHAFQILYRTTTEGKLEPTYLLWSNEKNRKVGSEKYFDDTDFLVSINGELKAAASYNGKVNATLPQKLNIKSAKVKEAFVLEKQFYLTDSVSLGYSTK